MHRLVELAKQTVETFVKTHRMISAPAPLPEPMRAKAGVFVCIKNQGELRGCVGTLSPSSENVAEETIRNAIAAASKDSRFSPVSVGELEDLSYTVDVLSPAEPIKDLSLLDPRRYGVTVSRGGRRGLLLPDLEGVDTVEEQLRIALMKAGISSDEEYEVARFTVERYV